MNKILVIIMLVLTIQVYAQDVNLTIRVNAPANTPLKILSSQSATKGFGDFGFIQKAKSLIRLTTIYG